MSTPRRSLLLALLALAACSTEPEGPDGGTRDARPPLDAASASDAESGAQDAAASGADAGATPDASQGPRSCSEVTSTALDLPNYEAVLGCLRNPAENGAAKSAAVETFVRAVESHGGFPIVAGDEVVFVYVRSAAFDAEDDAKNADEDFSATRRGEPVRVAGEFNAWQPTLTLASEGSDFFHARTTLAAAGKRWAYKYVAKEGAADVWFSDPLSRRFDYDANGRYSIVLGGTAKGHLEWIRKVHATRLDNDRLVYLYVPRGYDGGATRYPVLYLHDGNNAFSTNQPWSAPASWDVDGVAEVEITAGRAKEFLVVAVPNNADRMAEYTHVPDDIGGGNVVGGKGEDYADFLVNDLKPLVDARYRTRPEKEHTGILGSSLGGLISYYVAWKHPSVFKYVGGMSSTFDWGLWGTVKQKTVVQLYSETADLGTRGQVYYLDSGGKIPAGGCKFDGNDDDADNYCGTLNMKNALVGKGIDTFPDDPTADRLEPNGVDILHFFQAGAQHNEAAWNARLPMALRLFERP